MNKIKLLPPEIYTRIAAGEVIERPANVVKELIENSIDALSTEIIIEIVSSGRKLIRVTDNGIGMGKEDLTLAIQPHATSKIEKYEDIYNLSTLGFRGEALSSIVNVSKTTIISKQKESTVGYKLVVHAGEIISVSECATNNGTIVEVKDLFYNVPARLKFLKSDHTEKIHIIRTIEEYAIVNHNISFKLYSDNELIFSVSATDDLINRIKDVSKKFTIEQIISFTYEDDTFKIVGFVAPVEYSQVNKSLQMFYVNNRPVSSRMLTQVLYDAYRDNLPTGRHPIGLLFIYLPPDKIDVNVHPTKRIIKFYNEEHVYHTLKNLIQQKVKEYYIKGKPEQVTQKFPLQTWSNKNLIVQNEENVLRIDTKQKPEEQKLKPKLETDKLSFTEPENNLEKLGFKNFVYLGQLHRTYLVFETENGMTLIDQHAASERILYEKFLNSTVIESQKLLFPINIELKLSDFETIKMYIETINNLGFEVIISGKSSIAFYSIPSLFSVSDVKDFLSRFIENLISDIKEEIQNVSPREKIIRSACRAAVKANDLLSLSEINKLLSDIASCNQPFFCPHGRPTILHLELSKIEKLFSRKK